jgi:vacuolar-type H+-ATPase subunit E/Vma4
MSLEDVKGDILRKAKSQSDAILKDAHTEEERILAKAKDAAAELKIEKTASIKQEVEQMKKKAGAAAELEKRKAILTERKNLIDETFDRANDLLTKIPQDEMKKKLSALVKKAGNEIDIGIIHCNKRDAGIISGKSKTSTISGGIIAESEDGNVSVDYCFESLLEEIKDKHTEEVSNILFK